jgi:hypothetical protein
MAKFEQVDIRAIFAGVKGLRESLRKLKEQISSLGSEFKNIYTLKSLLEEYRDLRIQFLTILKDQNLYNVLPDVSYDFLYLKFEYPPSLKPYLYQTDDIDMALSMLDRAERGCSIMISVCESLLKPKIPQESLEKLPQLWSEVEEIEKKIPEGKEFLVRNIREALGEYEQGHFLASALISSRVITYVFEKIPRPRETQMLKDQMRKEDQRARPSSAELKVRTLIERGIVDEGRREEQESFLKFSKEARNILSHQAHIFPDATEALMLITSAITFCKYLIRLGPSNDNDVS